MYIKINLINVFGATVHIKMKKLFKNQRVIIKLITTLTLNCSAVEIHRYSSNNEIYSYSLSVINS